MQSPAALPCGGGPSKVGFLGFRVESRASQPRHPSARLIRPSTSTRLRLANGNGFTCRRTCQNAPPKPHMWIRFAPKTSLKTGSVRQNRAVTHHQNLWLNFGCVVCVQRRPSTVVLCPFTSRPFIAEAPGYSGCVACTSHPPLMRFNIVKWKQNTRRHHFRPSMAPDPLPGTPRSVHAMATAACSGLCPGPGQLVQPP